MKKISIFHLTLKKEKGMKPHGVHEILHFGENFL